MTMKAGLITSAAMHAVVLGLCVMSLSSPMPFNAMETEPLPVSLVPLGYEMSVRKGDLQAAKAEKPAPKPTQRPPEKLDAEHVGESKIDTKLPFKPKEKPRDVKATPPPSGMPDAKPEIASQEKAKEPQPDNSGVQAVEVQPKPEPAQEKPVEKPEVKPAEKAEIKPAETAQAEKAPDSATELPKKGPVPDAKPQQTAKKTDPKPKEEKKPSSSAKGDSIDSILAMNQSALVDKTRTQGGGAKRSAEPAALGGQKDIGNAAFQQTLNNIIGRCVQGQWDLAAISGSTAYDLRVVVHFQLNQDGTLNGEPELKPAGGDGAQRDIIAIQALAALKKCAPFALPVEKYSQWHDVTINMKAFPD